MSLFDLRGHRWAEIGERGLRLTNIFDRSDAHSFEPLVQTLGEIGRHRVDHPDHGLIALHPGIHVLAQRLYRSGRVAKQARAIQVVERQHLCLGAVVNVVGEIGDLVGQIDNLGFQTGKKSGVELLRGRTGFKIGMLDNPFANLEGQVKTAKMRVADLDPVDRAQALRVMVETSVPLHSLMQNMLAGVAEWRMAQVVRQRNGLRQILVESQRARDRARNLGNLHRVSQTGTVIVALVIYEYLSLVLEAAKSG